MINIRIYKDGSFAKWFESLNWEAKAKIQVALTKVKLGNTGNCKSLGQGLYEIKINHGSGYRVYYGNEGDHIIIILAGGTKKKQNIDIKNAHMLWEKYKQQEKRKVINISDHM